MYDALAEHDEAQTDQHDTAEVKSTYSNSVREIAIFRVSTLVRRFPVV
jgi:hypothetical protein